MQNYRSLVLDQQIVFEAHLLRETTDGSIRLEVDQWGPKHAVSIFFHDAVLEQEVRKVANKRDGLGTGNWSVLAGWPALAAEPAPGAGSNELRVCVRFTGAVRPALHRLAAVDQPAGARDVARIVPG